MSTQAATPIAVIGTGTAADTRLSQQAIDALQSATLIIGSGHQFEAVAPWLEGCVAERRPYPSPLSELKLLLDRNRSQRLVILASGDPLFFGIGAWLGRNLEPGRLQFFANISSVQSAFARIQRPWQNARVISLHGRPLHSLRSGLQNQRLYALLTDSKSSPQRIAEELLHHGFERSTLWVCEDLGGADERIREFEAAALQDSDEQFHPLNVVLVETAGNGGYLPEFPGIRDEDFVTGAEPGRGMLSKREVRLNILSLLAPVAAESGWDVGAGCGGVAVEWARWNRLGQVQAIEYHPERLQHLHANRERFGVAQNLRVVEGMAPHALTELPDPDAIFIGGSSGDLAAILELCWSRLKPGGRLVCAAVTEHTRMELHHFAAALPDDCGEWLEIAVSKGDKLGGRLVLRPQMPVLLVRFDKPRAGQCPSANPTEDQS